MAGILWESGFNEVILLGFNIYNYGRSKKKKLYRLHFGYWVGQFQLIYVLYHPNYVQINESTASCRRLSIQFPYHSPYLGQVCN